MPNKLPSPCRFQGCPELVSGRRGYCLNHSKFMTVNRFEPGTNKYDASRFYRGRTWKQLRMMFIRANPLCASCGAVADEIDHKTPIGAGGDRTAWSNLQSLCRACHGLKTRNETLGEK